MGETIGRRAEQLKPIMTIWGPVPFEAGPMDPEWEYRRCPEVRSLVRQLNMRIKSTEERIRRESLQEQS